MSAPHTISRIDVFRHRIPLREPFKIALQTTAVADNVFVRLTSREGREGWGEASPLHAVTGETVGTCVAAAEPLGRSLLGSDALETRRAEAAMKALLPHNPAIRSAFDIALHDLAAQAAGLPLYRLLGGSPRELVTDLTLGIDPPEVSAEKALRAKAMGFGRLKMKLGLSRERDFAAVAAVREAVGPGVEIRLDANQAWDRQEAVETLRRLEPFGLHFCEQPVRKEDLEGLAFVAERTAVSIMADESVFGASDVMRVGRLGSVPYLNLKVAKTGGVGSLLRADAVAATGGLVSMLGCMMESRLGLTASAHAALATESVRFLDLDTPFELAEDPVLGGIRYERDRIMVPESPGLGAAVDAASLEPSLRIE